MLGTGASTGVHVLPFHISMRPNSFPLVSWYSPTATHEVVEAHDTGLPVYSNPPKETPSSWSPSVPAFGGSGATTALQFEPYPVSIIP